MMRVTCDYRRGYGLRCGTPMLEHIDRLGRVQFVCPTCARREAGRCADCPAKVDGQVGRALPCAACRAERRRVAALRHWHRHHEQNCARRRRRERIHAHHPLTPQESGRRGGLIGGRHRMDAMTAEERRAFAAIGGRRGGLVSQAQRSPAEKTAIGKKGNAIRWARARALASTSCVEGAA